MVCHDSISILIPSDTIFADSSNFYDTIRFDTGVYRSILSYYIPILNNHTAHDCYSNNLERFICSGSPYIES